MSGYIPYNATACKAYALSFELKHGVKLDDTWAYAFLVLAEAKKREATKKKKKRLQ